MYEIYTSQFGQFITRTDDDGKVWGIPNDPANSDYRAYLDWLADGNEAVIVETESN